MAKYHSCLTDINCRIYNQEVREIHHDLGYIIINQSYWYPENKYTEEQAVKRFLESER